MTQVIFPTTDRTVDAAILKGGTANVLQKNGRFPPVSIRVKPLETGRAGIFFLDRFLSYQFNSSLLVPVDSFNFEFVNPDSAEPITDRLFEGDHITLYANNQHICSGILEQIEIEVEANSGEKVRLSGRNLMAQLNDQDAVNVNQKVITPNSYTVDYVCSQLTQNTRMLPVPLHRGTPVTAKRFATQPGESKLTALQRYLEPLNCIVWMSPGGQIIVGKPGFLNPAPIGRFFCRKSDRTANLLSIRATKSAATIPNVISAIWSAQEFTQNSLNKDQIFYNAAHGPSRLRKLGHFLPKTIVTSDPGAGSPADLAAVEDRAGQIALHKPQDINAGTLVTGYAKREIARQNKDELVVQVHVAGHYNEMGNPFLVDTVYSIDFDRAGIHEDMVLYQADFMLNEGQGQTTNLYFCRKGTIVPDQLIK
jgi:prophage tail gpP-like protein